MNSILFIVILTVIILMLIHWVLNSTMPAKKPQTKSTPQSKLKWETGALLLNYLEPENNNSESSYLLSYFKTSTSLPRVLYQIIPADIEKFFKNQSLIKPNNYNLAIKIYNSYTGEILQEYIISKTKGCILLEENLSTPYYALLGITINQAFYPLLVSKFILDDNEFTN